MKKYKRSSINLLKPIGKPNDTWTTIYNWVASVGRFSMLFVEILVLGVFVSRFVIDRINNDLTESINEKVTILSNPQYRSDEQYYRNMQLLLADVKKISALQPINSSVIASILSSVPSFLTLDKFSIDEGRVSMLLKGSDLVAIKDYEFSLKQNTTYTDVLFTITRSNATSIEYDVSVSFNVGNLKNKK